MKRLKKILAVALAILTMLTVSIPAGAAGVRYQIRTTNSCPSSNQLRQVCSDGSCSQADLLRHLCSDGSCGNYYRLFICSGKNCTNTRQPADTPAAKPTEPAAVPTESPTEQIAQPTAPAQSADASALSAYEQEVVALTNQYRAQNGLSPLTVDTHLSEIARMKSQDMHDKGYFDHNSPTYGSPFDMMKRFGVSYHTAGENIAMGYRTAQSVVDGWMNSPGHRANILNKSFTKIGVGYLADGSYCTQMFIG